MRYDLIYNEVLEVLGAGEAVHSRTVMSLSRNEQFELIIAHWHGGFMSVLTTRGLKVSPEMVRVNSAYDSDCARAVWDFLRRWAEEGKAVNLVVDEQTFSPADVANLVGVSRATVQRRIDDGTIRAIRRGSRWRVPDAEVERYSKFLMGQRADLVADELEF